MLKKLSTLVAAGAFVALLMPSAQAMTPAPVTSTSDIIQVAGGCGPGMHRGPGMRCYPNRRGPVCRSWRGPRGHWHRECR